MPITRPRTALLSALSSRAVASVLAKNDDDDEEGRVTGPLRRKPRRKWRDLNLSRVRGSRLSRVPDPEQRTSFQTRLGKDPCG